MLYIKEELDLNTFKAWGGAVSRLEEIKELGMIELAQECIEIIFMDEENVTETDINDALWFDMDDFIESYKEEEAEKEKEKGTNIQELIIKKYL